MGDFSTDRLAPSSRVIEPKPQQGQRDLAKPPRRKPLAKNSSEESEAPDPQTPPHTLDSLA